MGEMERHVLTEFADIEVSCVVRDSGQVDIYIGDENLSPETLGRIVSFVEKHADVTVVGRDA